MGYQIRYIISSFLTDDLGTIRPPHASSELCSKISTAQCDIWSGFLCFFAFLVDSLGMGVIDPGIPSVRFIGFLAHRFAYQSEPNSLHAVVSF